MGKIRSIRGKNPVSSLLVVSGWLAVGGVGVRGKRDLRCCFYHPPWQLLGWRLGWKDCCCCWLLLDLLAIPTMLCSVAASGVMLPTVPDSHRKKEINRHGKRWPDTLCSPPGQLARRELRASPGGGGQHSWTEIFLSTPLAADFWPGPEAEAERRAAGRGILLYASRHRFRAWPGWGGRGEAKLCLVTGPNTI